MEIEVGDVCIINCDCEFPADMILLNSNLDSGIAYVETSNLDGEKALKIKEVIKGGDSIVEN